MSKKVETDVRVSVSLHFTFNPTKELAHIPSEVTKTIAVGDEVIPEKVQGERVFQGPTKDKLISMMEKLVIEAQKKAKPAAAKKPDPAPAEKKEEDSAQPSLL